MNVMFKLGTMFFTANEMASAENAFENFIFNAVLTDNRLDEARLYMERIKFRTGEYSSESDIAENFVAKYPDSPKAPGLLFDLARYYRTVGKTNDAVEKYEILMNNPRYSAYADSAAILIADTFDAAKQRDRAVVFLIRTAEVENNPVRTQRMYLKLGQLNETWGEYDEAIGWYDRALAINASSNLSFRALWGIGRTFKTLNRWFEAAKTLERVIAEHPKRLELIDVYMALSDVYFLQGRLSESISIAEKAVTLADSSRKNEILLFIAEMYEEIDDDHALKLYSFLYSNKTNAPEYRIKALLQYGDLSLRKGDRRAALTAYNRVLSEGADSVAVMKAKDRLARIGINEAGMEPQQPRQ
jgi:tetratricopeptide (TPR) repeat protein